MLIAAFLKYLLLSFITGTQKPPAPAGKLCSISAWLCSTYQLQRKNELEPVNKQTNLRFKVAFEQNPAITKSSVVFEF